jgi:hypothetical protein
VSEPWIGNSGSVVYKVTQGGPAPTPGVYAGSFPVVIGVPAIEPHINDTDNVAFEASAFPGGSLFRNVIPLLDQNSLVRTAGSGLTINNANDIAFIGQTDTEFGVYVVRGAGSVERYVSNLTTPTIGDFHYPVINNAGKIVYQGQVGAATGIFDGPAPSDKVILANPLGTSLFGFGISGLKFYRGFNDAGQVAFAYELGNGQTGIALATPRDPATVGNGNFNNGLAIFTRTGNQDASVVNVAGDPVLQMTTVTSPTGIKQLVRTSQTPYLLQFDYDWLTTAGSLAVTVNGQQVLNITPQGISSSLGTPTLDVLGDFTRLTLALTPAAFDPNSSFVAFDLSPGSLAQIRLDNISFQAVPEPSMFTLLTLAIAALLSPRRRTFLPQR